MKRGVGPVGHSIALVGGGRMGGDLAATFAAGGWQVHVVEPAQPARASLPARVRTALKALSPVDATVGRRAWMQVHLQKVQAHEALDTVPWPAIDLVIESIPEKLPPKQRLFERLEREVRASTILATNSSSLLPSDVFARVARRSRTAAVHFVSPAHRVPVVEVVRTQATSAPTIRRIDGWLRDLGKLPVHLNTEVPGMLVNRLQHAMMREALSMIDAGITDIESIDLAVRFGFGFRYLAAGPLKQRDMNGLVIHWESARQLYPTLSNAKRPAKLFDRLIAAGHVGARAGRGFHPWDAASTPATMARYDRLIAAALALLEPERRALARRRP